MTKPISLNNSPNHFEDRAILPHLGADESVWYAVHTRARHEKTVAAQLAEKRITAFVPTVRQVHTWSDRKKVVEIPFFSCYVFVRVPTWREVHLPVLSTPGVLRWVGSHFEPAEIPDREIAAVRTAIASGSDPSPYPFLKVGQRIRVCGGCLDGVEGILVGKDGTSRLVISIDLIQQAMAVTLDGYRVVPV